MSDSKKSEDELFRSRKYRAEHQALIRAEEWESKKLPNKVKKHTTLLPTNLAHSNLFMFNTRNKDWLLDDFPIISRWIPKEYSISYTGSGLDSFNLDVFLTLIKLMETRERINPKYLEDYAEKVLEFDEAYNVLIPAEKEAYKKEKAQNYNLAEGIFLQMDEFVKLLGLTKGGKTSEAVKDALSQLSRGTLTLKTDFQDERVDFEVTERLIYFVYLPKTESFYVSITPFTFDMFLLKTSIINTHVMRNISVKKGGNKRVDAALYSMVMTYGRGKVWTIDITDLLIKSPYYLMKQRHDSVITKGKIAYALPDGKVDEVGISIKKLNDYISNNRRDIIEFFTRLQNMGVLTFQTDGRGDNLKISFLIPKDIEKLATHSILLRDEAVAQLDLNLDTESDYDSDK